MRARLRFVALAVGTVVVWAIPLSPIVSGNGYPTEKDIVNSPEGVVAAFLSIAPVAHLAQDSELPAAGTIRKVMERILDDQVRYTHTYLGRVVRDEVLPREAFLEELSYAPPSAVTYRFTRTTVDYGPPVTVRGTLRVSIRIVYPHFPEVAGYLNLSMPRSFTLRQFEGLCKITGVTDGDITWNVSRSQ